MSRDRGEADFMLKWPAVEVLPCDWLARYSGLTELYLIKNNFDFIFLYFMTAFLQ